MEQSLTEKLQALAEASLPLWDLPGDATVRLINVSENHTYLIEAAEDRAVLRVHRAGYHSQRAIASELAWLDALSAARAIETPRYRLGRDGAAIQSARLGCETRFMVLFDVIPGAAPAEDGDLTAHFRILGRLAAACHDHAHQWQRPDAFQRFTWDVNAVFGPNPTWGRWQDAPGITPEIATTLSRVEAAIMTRLTAFGRGPERFGLIHADMRLANLLEDGPHMRVIDFDDCGFGWFLYDFAAAISFMEDDPRMPDLRAAWIAGYRNVRSLPAKDAAEIDTFIMLRRMALLAWIGSHIEAPEPQALAPDFAKRTAALGERWLAALG